MEIPTVTRSRPSSVAYQQMPNPCHRLWRPSSKKLNKNSLKVSFLNQRVKPPSRSRSLWMCARQTPFGALLRLSTWSSKLPKKSESCIVPNLNFAVVQAALSKVRTTSQTPAHFPAVESSKTDPLWDALIAIKAARDAVLAGRYGAAPAKGVRSTYPYRLWADIFETVGSSEGNSLMRALQTKGFAKTRGKWGSVVRRAALVVPWRQ